MLARFVLRLSVLVATVWAVAWPMMLVAVGGDLPPGGLGRLAAISFGGALIIVALGAGLAWVLALPQMRR
jgi:hypothetical protein